MVVNHMDLYRSGGDRRPRRARARRLPGTGSRDVHRMGGPGARRHREPFPRPHLPRNPDHAQREPRRTHRGAPVVVLILALDASTPVTTVAVARGTRPRDPRRGLHHGPRRLRNAAPRRARRPRPRRGGTRLRRTRARRGRTGNVHGHPHSGCDGPRALGRHAASPSRRTPPWMPSPPPRSRARPTCSRCSTPEGGRSSPAGSPRPDQRPASTASGRKSCLWRESRSSSATAPCVTVRTSPDLGRIPPDGSPLHRVTAAGHVVSADLAPVRPEDLVPIYVREPDAEVRRDLNPWSRP